MLESSGVLVCARDELFTGPEALALSGFLAGYSGLTRDAYALDLRQFAAWVTGVGMRLFETRRVHIEAFARELEARGRARATLARRLGTIPCFYRMLMNAPGSTKPQSIARRRLRAPISSPGSS